MCPDVDHYYNDLGVMTLKGKIIPSPRFFGLPSYNVWMNTNEDQTDLRRFSPLESAYG